MVVLPDLATLQLCSAVASTAFALMFLALWQGRRAERHWLCWAAGALGYVLVVAGFALTGQAGARALFYAGLGTTNGLILMGVRLFDGRPAVPRWLPWLSAAPGLAYALPLPFAAGAEAAWACRVGGMLALAANMGIVGGILLWGHARVPTRGRRIAGAACLGYLPSYAIGLAAEFGGVQPGLATLLPLLSDQLLLPVLNFGLMVMPGERAQEELRTAALKDSLTGAWNRAGLRARTAATPLRRAAIILIDVDHFKALNDRFGHATGDAVLTALAAGVAARLPGPEDLVARLGGDEFVVVLHDTTLARAQRFAEEVRAATPRDPGLPPWTVSLGVAMNAGGLDESMARADRALYRAKASGRDRAA
ncbi:GGDEF domain-containing protein [Methylobacterium sp. ID0610]|uniref:GGDEF domain-containing protein n=1 Tax=Methylobacterium carpenticola TaxID=3344827 RepID=UPI00369EDE59